MPVAVSLTDSGDLTEVLVYAAIAGLIGAFVGELITKRGKSGDWGGLEFPSSRGTRTNRFYDLGSFASIPIGVVAGCIAALTLAPQTQTVKDDVVTKTMDTEGVLAAALVGGLAGAAFLRVLQDRFLAVAKTQELRGVVKAAADSLADDDATGLPAPPAAAVEKVKQATDDRAATAVIRDISANANHASEARVDGARRALLAAIEQ